MKKVLLISLGCVKNTVDSETLLSFFKRSGFEIVLNPKDADAIVINTCGFIEDAKKESIDVILNYSKYQKKLVVVGCLAQRYEKELKESIPEIDLIVPITNYKNLPILIKSLFNDEVFQEYNPYYRVLSTPKFSAYLKISDGCSNHCAYCAIPLIRGEFHSVPKEELLKEAKRLASLNIKELIIISQDTTKYGTDIYKDYDIVNLLQDILNLKAFRFIRLLYLYSYEVSDRLINLIKENNEVLLPYFDIPIQHSTNKMLKLMNRKDTKKDIIKLYNKIKSTYKKAILRTTIIVGFPHENNKDFNSLKSFLNKYKFDHLGVFTYSKEEGTAGFLMGDQVREKTKIKRKNELMKQQTFISYELNKKHIGEEMIGIITNKLKDSNEYCVRTYFNAPDDIDGNIYVKSSFELSEGDIVKIKILSSSIYDLSGEAVKVIEKFE